MTYPGTLKRAQPSKQAALRDQVQSLVRGLSVIRAFDGEAQLTLSGVAQRTGLTRAAARRGRFGAIRQMASLSATLLDGSVNRLLSKTNKPTPRRGTAKSAIPATLACARSAERPGSLWSHKRLRPKRMKRTLRSQTRSTTIVKNAAAGRTRRLNKVNAKGRVTSPTAAPNTKLAPIPMFVAANASLTFAGDSGESKARQRKARSKLVVLDTTMADASKNPLVWLKLCRTSVQLMPRQSRHKTILVSSRRATVFRCLRKWPP